MTQEEKELLLKDLCARLPYGVYCKDFRYDDNGNVIDTIVTLEYINPRSGVYKYVESSAKHDVSRIKPYLRPMSSMTEEEDTRRCAFLDDIEGGVEDTIPNYIDWLNANHFDYHGLIPMGLALAAPEEMYN